MELQKTAYIIIISSLILIILLFTYLNFRQSSVSAETESEELGICHSLVYNGEDRIDLLFLASEEDTKRFSDTILNTPPYTGNKDYFNVFFIPLLDIIYKLKYGLTIFLDVSRTHWVAMTTAIALSMIAIAALSLGRNRKKRGLSVETILILIVYMVGNLLLYRFR